MTPHDPGDGRAAYELRINGLLGPVLLKALPHAAVSHAPRHTLRVTVDDDVALLDVLQAIMDTGVEVDAVREISTARDEAADDKPEPA
jgi:hypothetical protein